MKPHRPIRRTSTARAKQLREYAVAKKAFMADHHICFACGFFVAYWDKALHHFYKRGGRLLCWVPGFRLAHNSCHTLIHADETRARNQGWLAPKECCDDFARAQTHHEANK